MVDVSSLHSLLTLCADGPSAIDGVELYRPDYPKRVLSGEAIPGTMERIELRSAFVGGGFAGAAEAPGAAPNAGVVRRCRRHRDGCYLA